MSDRLVAAEDGDRAQLLLVGALSLAIALVAVALVLNSAIYTHNLASRQDTPSDDVVTFTRDVRASAGGYLDSANRNEGVNGYGAVGNTYAGGLDGVAGTVDDRAAVDVAATRVGHVANSQVRGVRVVDAGGGTFQPRTGPSEFPADTWVVAHAVRVRSFRVDVEPSDLGLLDQLGLGDAEDALQDPTSDDVFVVEFTDDVATPSAGETWRVAVYEDGDGDPTVGVLELGSGITRTCSVDDSSVPDPLTLDLTGARFGGQACAPLSFVDDLPDKYSVKYYEADEIEGSYELFADLSVDGAGDEAGVFTDGVDALNYGEHCDGPTYWAGTSGDYPRVVPAYYATDLSFRYESPDVTFVGTQRVALAEPGPAPTSPRVQSVDVTDSSGASSDLEFEVDVTVSDPNGDLDSLTVEVIDDDGDVVDDADYDDSDPELDGDSADVSPSLTDDEDDEGPYTVRVTVGDDAGDEHVVNQTHDADGDTSGCPA
ncbi:hypothetical protein N0B31_02595 [Salinirubellus salinus]|uniref:Uncharacterized protein n=1 Tax=Salinirubellus salinus TaxID=1364945 RepID=A0A9E7R4R2_9EURY|nr:hypothetical protein [Salinirubellus salinus]UWM55179.1 hypothetical protein N0B31_02595 [Salinirubellus salinus]